MRRRVKTHTVLPSDSSSDSDSNDSIKTKMALEWRPLGTMESQSEDIPGDQSILYTLKGNVKLIIFVWLALGPTEHCAQAYKRNGVYSVEDADCKPSDVRTSIQGKKYCDDEVNKESARKFEAWSNRTSTINANDSEDRGDMIAYAYRAKKVKKIETKVPKEHLDPGDEGWCGSYWDSEYGEEVYDEYCGGEDRRLLPSYAEWGFFVKSEDPWPEWTIFHHRKSETYSSATHMAGAKIYDIDGGPWHCEGTRRGRPLMKGALHRDNFVASAKDGTTTAPEVHAHEINGDIYLKGVEILDKSYPCSEPECNVEELNDSILKISNPHSSPCSKWFRPWYGAGGGIWTPMEDMANHQQSEQPCSDRDCRNRWFGCVNYNCRKTGPNCDIVAPSCDSEN